MERNDNEIRATIRQHLIELRKEKGYTQADVSKITGKNCKTVASWEQGISLPDAYTLYRLSKHYGVTMDFMYGDTEFRDVRIVPVNTKELTVDEMLKLGIIPPDNGFIKTNSKAARQRLATKTKSSKMGIG